MKDIFLQLQGKIPEDIIEQISDLILQEMQYQQIRDTAYQPSYKTLEEIRTKLEPLQKLQQEKTLLWENIQQLLNSQYTEFHSQAKERLSHILKEFLNLQNILQVLQKFCEQIQDSCHNNINAFQPILNEQQRAKNTLESLQTSLSSNFPKVTQDIAKLSQDVSRITQDLNKFAQTTRENWDSLERLSGKNLESIPKNIESLIKSIEPLQQQIAQQNKTLQNLPNQQEFLQIWEKFAAKFSQDFSNLHSQIKTLSNPNWINQLENLLQGKCSTEKIHSDLAQLLGIVPKWSDALQTIQTNIIQLSIKWEKNQTQNYSQQNNGFVEQRLQEIFSVLNHSKLQEIRPNLENLQDSLQSVKRIAQQLQPLLSLPQQLQIPENFAAIIENIPDNIKKVRDYLENFRHDVTLVAQHDLELLKATREQTTEYAKLQTTILPEIQSLQLSWQKLAMQLNNYWSSSQETFAKNMSDLAAATSRIKIALEDILRCQQEDEKRPRSSITSDPQASVSQDWRQEIRKEFAGIVQQIRQETSQILSQEIHKEMLGISQDIKQEMRKEILNLSQDIKKEITAIITESQKNFISESNKSIGQKTDVLSGEIHTSEKRIYDRMQMIEQTIQNKVQNMEQNIEGRMIGLKQYLDKLDENIVRIEQRAVAREFTNREAFVNTSGLSENRSSTLSSTSSIDMRITTKCPYCDKKVAALPSYQGKKVKCKECGKEFIFPILEK